MANALNHPTDLRFAVGGSRGSTSMMSTPAMVRTTSGRMRASCMLLTLLVAGLAGEKRGRCRMGRCGRVAQSVHAAIDVADPVRKKDTNDNHGNSHRPEREMLTSHEIVHRRAMHQGRFRAIEDALHHP